MVNFTAGFPSYPECFAVGMIGWYWSMIVSIYYMFSKYRMYLKLATTNPDVRLSKE
jgi:hypothetical protein